MDAKELPVATIKVGNRVRRNAGDLDSLCESIKRVGLMHPIVITKDRQLVAGLRRLEAYKLMDWPLIPTNTIETREQATHLLLAERDENQCRVPFTPLEAVEMGKAIEAIEAPKARERQQQKSGGKQGEKVCSGQSPEETFRQTRDVVGAAVGLSGRGYQRAKAVAQAAAEDPVTFGPIAEEMESTRKIAPAYHKVMAIKRGKPVRRKKHADDGKPVPEVRRKGALAALEDLSNRLDRLGILSQTQSSINAIRKAIEDV